MIDLDAFCTALVARPYCAYTPTLVSSIKACARGDRKAWAAIKPTPTGTYWLDTPCETLLADHDDEVTRRLLAVFVRLEVDSAVIAWMDKRGTYENHRFFSALVAEWETMGLPRADILAAAKRGWCHNLLSEQRKPTTIGAWVLSLPEGDLRQLETSSELALLFALHVPEHATPVIRWIFQERQSAKDKEEEWCARLAVELLAHDPTRWLDEALALLSRLKDPLARLCLLEALIIRRPDLTPATETAAVAAAAQTDNNWSVAAGSQGNVYASAWIARHCGERAGELLATAWGKPCPPIAVFDGRRAEAVSAAIATGNVTLSAALQVSAADTPRTAATAIGGLATLDAPPAALAAAVRALEQRCTVWLDDPTADNLSEHLATWRTVTPSETKGARRRYLSAAFAQAIERVGAAGALLETDALRWMGHEDSPVRRAAARMLAATPAGLPARLQPAITSRAADTRLAAVSCLIQASTAECLAALETILDAERSDDVRDAIMTVLTPLWTRNGRVIGDDELARWIKRAEKPLAKAVAAWLDDSVLPALKRHNGKKLTAPEVRWLCWRQARQGDIVADPEAAYLLTQIDRTSSGDFAQALFAGFLTSKQDAKDRWVLTLAGLLGDDRLVTPLRRQIDTWVQKSRGKLAEYAVQSLALLGSNPALQAVDEVTNAYRTKNRNVGSAANEAFTAAASRRGLTSEELGDAVVPWLGFTPGTARTVAGKKGPITVIVGVDGKLAYRDGNKSTSTLPSGVDKAVKDEMKFLAAQLRDSLKAQSLRHARMLVQQRRWPSAAWWALYGQHPVLRAYAVRLVWGIYDQQTLTRAFRVLEDGSLSDAHDEAVTLPPDARIGLVHPLELPEAQRSAWRNHLTDHEIDQPVPQLDRPVVRVKDSDRTNRRITQVKGTSLNGMTFKGRAERLGWRRGSVVDAGGISSYVKSYPATGIDVIAGVEGMFIGMGMEDSMTLGDGWFVRQGSVALGSYVYDEPSNDADPRVVSFGEVPEIVYSETMADLGLIAGKTADADDEE